MKQDVIDPEVASPSMPAVPDPKALIPRQIWYIIGNERVRAVQLLWDAQHPDGVPWPRRRPAWEKGKNSASKI
jgi:hypothetical protein